MNIKGIIKEAIIYPLSDWKKLLILGIIILISSIVSISVSLGINNVDIIMLLTGIGFIIGFLVNGYMFRVLKSSLDGKLELPKFNDWINMAVDGFKVFLAFIVYSIPVIFIITFSILSSLETYTLLQIFGINPFDLLISLLVSVIWPGILNLIGLSFNISFFLSGEVWGLFGIVYMIIITPIFLMAIANMAYYEGKISSAFKLREILEEISLIGWINLLKWYLLTGIIFMALFIIDIIITNVLFYFQSGILEISVVLMILTLIPFSYIFVARSVGLFYMPDKEE